MLRCYVAMMTMVVVAVTMMMGGVKGAFDEPDWGFQSYLRENFTLVCDHQSLKVQAHNHIEWTLPDGQLLTQTFSRHVLTSGLFGSVTNMRLTILNVRESDAGVYICHIYNNIRKDKKRGQLLRGLNLGGHKYREPFDEYRNNLMVAGLAALVLFVPLVTACFVYKFRYQSPEDREAKHAARLEATKHQRYLEAIGKGEGTAELSDVTVTVEKGERNPGYENGNDETGTRL